MTRKLLAIVALLFVLVLSGCGNQSGDIQQGPWYEAGKAESPGEPWPREILKEGAGPVTTPGSLVFIMLVKEPDESKSASSQAEFIHLNQERLVLWLGTPPDPETRKTARSFDIGDDRFRATLIGVAEGSEIRMTLRSGGSGGTLPLKGLRGMDDESPEYRQYTGTGTGRQLVTITQVCEAKLYRRDGLIYEVGLKAHGDRGFTTERRWRAQWGKLEGNCKSKPFKYEIGPNSIEENASRITLRDKNGKIIEYRSIEDVR